MEAGKGSLHYKQPPSEVPLPKSVALAGGCLCIRKGLWEYQRLTKL
jgi:hypothetical protein